MIDAIAISTLAASIVSKCYSKKAAGREGIVYFQGGVLLKCVGSEGK